MPSKETQHPQYSLIEWKRAKTKYTYWKWVRIQMSKSRKKYGKEK